METLPVPAFPPVDCDKSVDVCIVGAGIAGLSTAYLLAREGRKVVVLDDGPILSGETERTTAHLASALDDHFFELERMHGIEGSRLAAQSHAAAIDQIEEIVTREAIDCDFIRLHGYLFAAPESPKDILDRELEAARRAGLTVEPVARAPVSSFDSGRALRFSNQGQFHPLKYLAALAQAITRQGGSIYSHTHATTITGGRTPKVTTTAGHVITSQSIVVATNTPVNDRVIMHTKQAPYRTYVIGARVSVEAIPLALLWDTANPYHYVRLQMLGTPERSEQAILIVGGEDHKTGQAHDFDERFLRLEAWTRERFVIDKVEFKWSGQVMEPADSLAFIGRNPGDENVFIATGDSGHGMTHGTIAGMLLTDLICGRQNPWAELYDPSRAPRHSTGEFLRENLNVAKQYTDYISAGDVENEQLIGPDTGAIINRQGKKLAVYRDATGVLHAHSAVCPHLGCVVNWNSTEKTWDCPCHGSRFDPLGHVVNGPANDNLSPAKLTGSTKTCP